MHYAIDSWIDRMKLHSSDVTERTLLVLVATNHSFSFPRVHSASPPPSYTRVLSPLGSTDTHRPPSGSNLFDAFRLQPIKSGHVASRTRGWVRTHSGRIQPPRRFHRPPFPRTSPSSTQILDLADRNGPRLPAHSPRPIRLRLARGDSRGGIRSKVPPQVVATTESDGASSPLRDPMTECERADAITREG